MAGYLADGSGTSDADRGLCHGAKGARGTTSPILRPSKEIRLQLLSAADRGIANYIADVQIRSEFNRNASGHLADVVRHGGDHGRCFFRARCPRDGTVFL